MPWLRAVYGLRWEDIESMPAGELQAFIDGLPDVMHGLARPELLRRW